MIRATKISMKSGCLYSNILTEISQIFLEGDSLLKGYYSKEEVYDYLIKNPNSIQVGIYPFPNLIPALSSNNEKYVRSMPNDSTEDNLLKLPRNYKKYFFTTF